MTRTDSPPAPRLHVLDTTALSAAMRYDDAVHTFLASLRPGDVAAAHGAVVVTANLVHFSRIAGLEVCHWQS